MIQMIESIWSTKLGVLPLQTLTSKEILKKNLIEIIEIKLQRCYFLK